MNVGVVSGWLETERFDGFPVEFASIPFLLADIDRLEEFQEDVEQLEEIWVLETDCEEEVEAERKYVEDCVESETDTLEPVFTPTDVRAVEEIEAALEKRGISEKRRNIEVAMLASSKRPSGTLQQERNMLLHFIEILRKIINYISLHSESQGLLVLGVASI